MKLPMSFHRQIHLSPILLAIILSLAHQVQGAVILANYPFVTLSSDTTQPNTTVTPVSFSPTNATPGHANVAAPGSAQNVSWTESASTARNQVDAFISGDYIEFTLTPSSGFALNLTQLTFNYGGSGSNFTANFFVRSSVDLGSGSYNTDVGSLVSYVVPPSSGSGNVPGTFSVDLSALSAFQSLNSAVTFRAYAYIDNLTSGFSTTMRPRLDNLQLQGDIAVVPEPRSVALMALAFTGWLIFFRKAKSRGMTSQP